MGEIMTQRFFFFFVFVNGAYQQIARYTHGAEKSHSYGSLHQRDF